MVHHSCFSYDITDEYWRDYAEIADIECCIINNKTDYEDFRKELRFNKSLLYTEQSLAKN